MYYMYFCYFHHFRSTGVQPILEQGESSATAPAVASSIPSSPGRRYSILAAKPPRGVPSILSTTNLPNEKSPDMTLARSDTVPLILMIIVLIFC